jgi:hypothetical protein
MIWSCPPDVALRASPLQQGPAIQVLSGETFSASLPSHRLHSLDRELSAAAWAAAMPSAICAARSSSLRGESTGAMGEP